MGWRRWGGGGRKRRSAACGGGHSSTTAPQGGTLATLAGVLTLLLGATAVFGELAAVLNLIWEVQPKPFSGVGSALGDWLKQRVFSLAIVFAIAFLRLVSLIISAALAGAATYLRGLDDTSLLSGRRARPGGGGGGGGGGYGVVGGGGRGGGRAVTMPRARPCRGRRERRCHVAGCPRWSHLDEEKLRAHRQGDHKVQGEAQHGGHIYPRDVAERRMVAGLFSDRDRAGQAIDALKEAGFTGDQIGIAMRDRTAQGVLLEEAGTQAAEEAATTGAVGGAPRRPRGLIDWDRRPGHSGPWTGRGRRDVGDRLRGGWRHGGGRRGHRRSRRGSLAP